MTAEDIKSIITDLASDPKQVREFLALLGIEDDQIEQNVGQDFDETDGAALSSSIFEKLTNKELPYKGLAAALDNSPLKRQGLVVKHCLIDQGK